MPLILIGNDVIKAVYTHLQSLEARASARTRPVADGLLLVSVATRGADPIGISHGITCMIAWALAVPYGLACWVGVV